MTQLQMETQMDSMDMVIKMVEESRRSFDAVLAVAKEAQRASREAQNASVKAEKALDEIKALQDEWRNDILITQGQANELRTLLHGKATLITKTLFGSNEKDYCKEWNKVIKGLWSIYRHKVNGNGCSYQQTPRMKFDKAKEYIESLGVSDYVAYRNRKWNDIRNFK